ncbi:MAG: regulatory iron-sulfur-containing complex subunit RicT, partial [Dehalococcoidia bacterium]
MADSAPRVAGVRFRNAGKIYYFDCAGMRLETGEYVVVQTARGPEVGRVVIAPDQVLINELGDDDLQPILRMATEPDLRKLDSLRERAKEILPEARQLADESRLAAQIDSADFTLDGGRLTLSFTSEERIDYRDFVRKAADRFGVRVDMRQLGARDRAKLAGGYGICGRELCCSSWLTTFPAISIRMAKDQELPLNPQKISGLCGRLLCCLSYEEEGYREMRATLPKIGQRCKVEASVIEGATLEDDVRIGPYSHLRPGA